VHLTAHDGGQCALSLASSPQLALPPELTRLAFHYSVTGSVLACTSIAPRM